MLYADLQLRCLCDASGRANGYSGVSGGPITLVSVGYPLFPVSRDISGGAEQILSIVEHALVRAGNESLVVAAEGSRVSGKLISTPGPDTAQLTDEMRTRAQQITARTLETVLARYSVDLVHFHGLDFHAYIPRTTVPMLATLHLPLSWYPDSIFNLKNVQLNCVSRSQAEGTGLPVVLNGVDTSWYRPASEKDDYLLWLGRVCPEKGVEIALRAAHALDMQLLVAGPVHAFESHRKYFEECIAPLLDGKRRHIGPVSGREKRDLLARAQCLLVPSLVAETSSLVAMEALSSGTPVVAARSGALPEVVDDGRTGFIVDSEQDMADAVRRLGEINPEICRRTAVARFEQSRMINDYMNLYESLTRQPTARV
ncbi:MAG: glycosyltransferase family 4 protein [Acidobacteriaceae bacterium]|nr:glycosyltransferase family 4 protein [Acidobacteriaceae bacterium]